MSFSENLKQIRKEKGLSQEELADLLEVSRQAVSKWEQGNGYPEVETLLCLSTKLNVSLDSLMAMELGKATDETQSYTGNITITSPNENLIIQCNKVITSGKFKGGKHSPRYALFAVGEGFSFWGQPTLFLGWYASEENLTKEVEQIRKAILHGESNYTLQYSAKTERQWARLKVVEEEPNL